MDKLAFGLTMMIVGIGGTFLTLTLLIWSIELLKKLFPLEPAQAGSAWQLLWWERIPPRWREKVPVETIRTQWSQGLASMQRVRVAWVQKLPIDRLQYRWHQTLRLEQMLARENRRAMFSSVRDRLSGRRTALSASNKTPADHHPDRTKQR